MEPRAVDEQERAQQPQQLHIQQHIHPASNSELPLEAPSDHDQRAGIAWAATPDRLHTPPTDRVADLRELQAPPAYDILELPDLSRQGDSKPAEDIVALPDFSQYLSLSQLQQFRKPALDILHVSQTLAQLRQETLLLRDNASYLKKSHAFKGDHLLESSEEVLAMLGNCSAGACRSVDIDARTLRLSEDRDAFRDAIAAYGVYEDELAKKESSMNRREETLMNAVQELAGLIQSFGDLSSRDIGPYTPPETHEQSTSRPTTPQLPDALAAYYDTAGTVGYLRERAGQVELDFREESLKRQLREDQEMPVDISKDLFEADYRVEREKALQALENAERALQMARERCLAEGMDPQADITQPVQHDRADEIVVAEETSSSHSERAANTGVIRSQSSTAQSSVSDYQQNSIETPSDRNVKARKPKRRKKRSTMKVQKWMEGAKAENLYTAKELAVLLGSFENLGTKPRPQRKWRSAEGLRDWYASTGHEIEETPFALQLRSQSQSHVETATTLRRPRSLRVSRFHSV